MSNRAAIRSSGKNRRTFARPYSLVCQDGRHKSCSGIRLVRHSNGERATHECKCPCHGIGQ